MSRYVNTDHCMHRHQLLVCGTLQLMPHKLNLSLLPVILIGLTANVMAWASHVSGMLRAASAVADTQQPAYTSTV